MSPVLELRDVHLPPSPSWWPLAPGYWVILAVLVLVLVGYLLVHWRRKQRVRHWLSDFDQRMAADADAVQQLALASELLRRAAMAHGAQRVVSDYGEAWLRWLDDGKSLGFVDGDGRLLLDGGYRSQVDPTQAAAAVALARHRYAALMAGVTH